MKNPEIFKLKSPAIVKLIPAIVKLVKDQCSLLARRYNQDKDDVLSYVLARLPGLLMRIDTGSYSERQCLSYIKKSARGYVLHYLRDVAPLIKTPRNCPPYSCQVLLDTDYIPNYETPLDIPWYIEQIMEDPYLGKRIINAYMRYLDT